MAFTQDDIDKLKRAIASGAKRVRFQTHEVEYQSTRDMLRALDEMQAEVSPASVGPRRTVGRFIR